MNKNNRNKISIYLFSIILILTIGYTYYQTKSFTRGPVLKIEEPLDGSLLETNLVMIKGSTENISYITINDRQVFVNEKGILNEKVLLSPGYNIINISAKDKYKREAVKKLELIYKK